METRNAVAQWFDDRYYRIPHEGGHVYLASVTTKLGIEAKPFLYKYYAELGWDQAQKKLREAGDRGSRIHYAFSVYNMGGTVLYNPWQNPIYSQKDIDALSVEAEGKIAILSNQDEMVALWKLQRFNDAVKPEILHSEMTVYSIEEKIVGTLDLAIKVKAGQYDVNGAKGLIIPNDMILIADLKTGNTVPESAWAQVAAYAEAYKDMGYPRPDGALIIHTGSTNKKGIEGLSCLLKTREELKPHYEIYQHLSAVYDARNPCAGPKAFEFPTIIKGEK